MAKKLLVNEEKITAVADAIRTKTNTTDKMTLDDMPTKISGISSGGGSLVTNPLPKPLSYIDYNTNTLYIWPHPLCGLFGADEWVDLTINGRKIPWTEFDKFRPVNNMDSNSSHATSIAGDTIIFGMAGSASNYPKDSHMGITLGDGDRKWIYHKGQGTTDMNRQLLTQSEYIIPKVKGSNSIKIKYKARNITEDNPKKITVNVPISPYENNMEANTIGNGLPEIANYNGTGFESKLSANLFTDSPEISYEYTLNEYNINLNNINYNGLTTDILYKDLNASGTLYTYDKSISYTFDTSNAGNGVTSTSSYYQTAIIDDGRIYSNFVGNNWYNTNYVKISFTLTEAKNVSINYVFNKAYSGYQYDGIFFGAVDKTMSITYNNYDSKSGITNCIYYAGDGSGADEKISTNDTSVHTYTYENVPAGEHYIQLRLYAYGYNDSYRPKITVTPVYDKIDTGKYLPTNITVTDTDTNEVIPDTEYEYSPYTGTFNIPMTHNWNMTAEASTLQLSPEVSPEILYSIDSSGNRKITAVINDEALVSIPIDIEMNGISQGSITTSPRGYGDKTLVPNINGENILKARSNVSGKQPGAYASRQFWFNATDKPLSSNEITLANTDRYQYVHNPTWMKNGGNILSFGMLGNDFGVYEYNPEMDEFKIIEKGNDIKNLLGGSQAGYYGFYQICDGNYIFGENGYTVYNRTTGENVHHTYVLADGSKNIRTIFNDDANTMAGFYGSVISGNNAYLFGRRKKNNEYYIGVIKVDLSTDTLSDASDYSSVVDCLPMTKKLAYSYCPFKIVTNLDPNGETIVHVLIPIQYSNKALWGVEIYTASIRNGIFAHKYEEASIAASAEWTDPSVLIGPSPASDGFFTVMAYSSNHLSSFQIFRCQISYKTSFNVIQKVNVTVGDGNNEYESYSYSGYDPGNLIIDYLHNRYLVISNYARWKIQRYYH